MTGASQKPLASSPPTTSVRCNFIATNVSTRQSLVVTYYRHTSRGIHADNVKHGSTFRNCTPLRLPALTLRIKLGQSIHYDIVADCRSAHPIRFQHHQSSDCRIPSCAQHLTKLPQSFVHSFKYF